MPDSIAADSRIQTEPAPAPPTIGSPATAFGCARDFLDNQLVYAVVSPRARGLSIGVNLNPDKYCNFDCVYCEVDRTTAAREPRLDPDLLTQELRRTLALVHSGELRAHPRYRQLPAELLELRSVTLSGDGEPTLCPNFIEAVQTVVHVRARRWFPFFKIILITNATGLDLPLVQAGLNLFTETDEVWAKLDAGTQAFMDKVNRSQAPLQKVLNNILALGRKRPVIIQSLFPLLDDAEPSEAEIGEYIARLKELKAGGAMIPLVQIYSATRPVASGPCGHLPLKRLSGIARQIRAETGLRAEVF